jgi:tetratricopeptide (TPR) repeat protein
MIKRILFVFLIFLIQTTFINAKKYSPLKDFTKANDLYTKKDINSSLNKYLKIFEKGYDNFELNYNIGCCYFKLGEYGKSRFYFERALNFKPFDPDLFHNLIVLYRIIQKNPFYAEQVIMNKRIIYFIPIYITIIILISLTIITLVFLLFVYIRKNNKKQFLIFFTVSLIITSFILIIFFIQYFDFNSNIFIIKSKNANVYLTPNELETVLTPVTEGTKGKILEEINGFIRVKLNDGLSGWIKKDNIISMQNLLK